MQAQLIGIAVNRDTTSRETMKPFDGKLKF